MRRLFLLSCLLTACLCLPALPAEAQLQGQVNETITYPASDQHAGQILSQLLGKNGLPATTVSRIRVVQAKELNAQTNGQEIVFSNALWDLLNTDDQRAFVISHELSHIVLNHIGQTQLRRAGLGILDYFLSRRISTTAHSQLLQQAANIGISLTDNKFSRTIEYQADERGIQLMANAGYRPQAALEVFNLFEQHSPNRNPEFLQSHPLSRSRIESLTRKYQPLFAGQP